MPRSAFGPREPSASRPGRRAGRGPTASSCSSSFVGTRTTAANRKNARPAVRNRSPSEATFWMSGMRDRDDVAKDQRPHEEVGGLARHDDVQRAGHVLRRQAGGLQARGPDRHVAAVEHDDHPVEQDADERDAETRVEPVDPQADQEEDEPGRQQRGPQHLDDVDARVEQRLRPEPDDDRRDEQQGPAQLDVAEIVQAPTRPEAEQQAEKDPRDQHGVMMLERGVPASGGNRAVRRDGPRPRIRRARSRTWRSGSPRPGQRRPSGRPPGR